MNRKGFTLVELLATIIVLALVMGIASYSIIKIMKNSKEKNYELLITNIKDAAEAYYQECKYARNDAITCNLSDVTLGTLVEYGFLKGNGKDSNDKYTLVNPRNDKNISNCHISISFSDGNIEINAESGDDCPTNEDYE